MKKTISLLGLTLAIGACGDDGGGTTDPPDMVTQEGTMSDFMENEYAGSSATLRRFMVDDPRLEADLTITNLTEGNVYTFWWIIFNNDEACVSTPNDEGKPRCGFDDFTAAQEDATVQSFAYGFPGPDGGAVAPADGTVTFPTRTYRITDMEGVGNANKGLTDVAGAEVHLLVRDHGPELAQDSEFYDAQFTTYFGGCANAPPEIGAMGPNECAEIAFTIFLDSTVDPSCTGHICP